MNCGLHLVFFSLSIFNKYINQINHSYSIATLSEHMIDSNKLSPTCSSSLGENSDFEICGRFGHQEHRSRSKIDEYYLFKIAIGSWRNIWNGIDCIRNVTLWTVCVCLCILYLQLNRRPYLTFCLTFDLICSFHRLTCDFVILLSHNHTPAAPLCTFHPHTHPQEGTILHARIDCYRIEFNAWENPTHF